MIDDEVFEILFDNEFVDRFEKEPEKAIDVFIPLLNSNQLFEKSLLNFYKMIPISRLLIGDGGCNDNSLEILKKFPRVTVFDHTKFKSQGFCIRQLIEACETDYCIYLHADVFLQEKFFDTMLSYKDKSDWFECNRKYITIMTWEGEEKNVKRSYSGAQFGNTKKLQEAISVVEDDFLQRNEDIIIAELMDMDRYLKIDDTIHYHQVLSKKGDKEPSLFITPTITRNPDVKWEKRIHDMQWRGIVKYCDPKPYLVSGTKAAINVLKKHNAFDAKEAKEWVLKTNAIWYQHLWDKKWWQVWKKDL